MQTFNLPTKKNISAGNRQYFDYFNRQLGTVPNFYAMLAHSNNALDIYHNLHAHKLELNRQEREAVSLVVAAVNGSEYCLKSHTMIGKLNGLTDEQIREIRTGSATFNPKLNALVRLVHSIVIYRGSPDTLLLEDFFERGYTVAHLVDTIIAIGDITISNMLCLTLKVPPDPE